MKLYSSTYIFISLLAFGITFSIQARETGGNAQQETIKAEATPGTATLPTTTETTRQEKKSRRELLKKTKPTVEMSDIVRTIALLLNLQDTEKASLEQKLSEYLAEIKADSQSPYINDIPYVEKILAVLPLKNTNKISPNDMQYFITNGKNIIRMLEELEIISQSAQDLSEMTFGEFGSYLGEKLATGKRNIMGAAQSVASPFIGAGRAVSAVPGRVSGAYGAASTFLSQQKQRALNLLAVGQNEQVQFWLKLIAGYATIEFLSALIQMRMRNDGSYQTITKIMVWVLPKYGLELGMNIMKKAAGYLWERKYVPLQKFFSLLLKFQRLTSTNPKWTLFIATVLKLTFDIPVTNSTAALLGFLILLPNEWLENLLKAFNALPAQVLNNPAQLEKVAEVTAKSLETLPGVAPVIEATKKVPSLKKRSLLPAQSLAAQSFRTRANSMKKQTKASPLQQAQPVKVEVPAAQAPQPTSTAPQATAPGMFENLKQRTSAAVEDVKSRGKEFIDKQFGFEKLRGRKASGKQQQ